MTSTIEVASASRISSKSPRVRVRTPTSSGRSPVTAAISSARSLEQRRERAADRAVAEQPDPERLRVRHRGR